MIIIISYKLTEIGSFVVRFSGVPGAVDAEVLGVLKLGAAPQAVEVPHPQVLCQNSLKHVEFRA